MKIANGTICTNCFESLPKIVQDNVEDLTAKQIVNSKKVIKVAHSLKDYWGKLGSFVYISNTKLIINGGEIAYRDLENISLNFHPQERGNYGNSVRGYSTIVITTKSPKIVMEHKFKNVELESIRFKIHGKDITYSFNKIWLRAIHEIKEVIAERSESLRHFRTEYDKYWENIKKNSNVLSSEEYEEYFRQIKEEADREWREQMQREEQTRSRTEQRRREQERAKAAGEKAKVKENLSAFDKALLLFELQIPFTKKELKIKRNELIKKVHPDEGGSDKKAALINEYYSLLKKFAA